MSAGRFSFAPFLRVLDTMDQDGTDTFAAIQGDFVGAMSAFDREQAAGSLTSGHNQHKGFFFNEVIARLIERGAGQGVARRGKRPGILLPSIDVDICYPADPGTRPEVIAETKMLGTPRHPKNPSTGRLGRPGNRDLDKRIREIALNVIDLKLADAEGGSRPIGDIATWIQQTTPPFFGFFGFRVVSDDDLAIITGRVQFLANSYANGVGLVLYRPVDPATPEGLVTYESIRPPGGMAIDDVVKRICRQIKSVQRKPRRDAHPPTAPILPPPPEA